MNINATVNYHIKSDSPQAFHFDVDGIVGNLISPELVSTEIRVNDVRGVNNAASFDRDGLAFVNAATRVSSFDQQSDWQSIYEQELHALLLKKLGAKEVIVFDHTVRTDNPEAERKPARNVHTDYSRAGAEQRLIDIVGQAKAAEFRNGAYGFVNVWRPVKRAITSSPLGFIRPSSIQEEDWLDIELIYPDRIGQILGVTANESHEWLYLSDMTPDEVAIFNIYDNSHRPRIAHSALDLASDVNAGHSPRTSIESRTLVRYS
ncbi:MAG: CmcJ/NvfI family oxidoreductase [Pseudomonadota bacterium]